MMAVLTQELSRTGGRLKLGRDPILENLQPSLRQTRVTFGPVLLCRKMLPATYIGARKGTIS
jgi:hypothetical protein